MKKLLLFCIMTVSSTAQAVIISVSHIKNSMPELAAKKFVFFGDMHESAPEDQYQLSALINSLHKKDRESSDKIHILMERPLGTDYDFYSVLGNLPANVADCRNVTLQNIEIRRCIGAAAHLLTIFSPILHSDYQRASEFYACKVRELTFGDVDHEVLSHKQEIDNWADTLQPLYANAMGRYEPEFKDLWNQYKKLCAAFSIVPSTNIVVLSKKLYKNDFDGRVCLSKTLTALGAVLLDMHIFKTIMSLKKPDIIVLIAGEFHTGRMGGILQQIGNREILIYAMYKDVDKPIPSALLDVEDGCYDSCFTMRNWLQFLRIVLCSANY